MILGAVSNGIDNENYYGIQIYPACGGSLAAGDVGDVLVDTNDFDSDSFYAVRKALAGGI